MKCPGQDSRYWQPGAIFESKCPQCGKLIEFFKDDTTRKCSRCGHRLANPKMDFGCASYCKFAEQCIGALPEELLAKRADLLKDRIAIEMKKHFGSDFKRISHAMRVARHAEKIGKAEGGDLAVILAAAYLHDIGAGKTNHQPQESQSPAAARTILSGLGAATGLIDEVCDLIIRLHAADSQDTLNFKILYDAAQVAVLEEKQKQGPLTQKTVSDMIENRLLTISGREIATQLLINAQEAKK